ncbi:hypothetical protein M670_00151 [Schinkia azotoformans MEV2011]|uniref:Uncharacterized protein n=1 Tax=Schinkia azotoformans MEV2011 TaxID=1348973 RepID=A0A072P3V6_SCHAZ|nr:hypothetical protein [Schinkia azotoformans]KEF40135.1 hypothetical protein M670_00151 [Schinkia azotoformans MEV2011]MEC1714730.1 hypothetical protein [Schinkia azotoformans]MEC1757514.1 hypothetical protein [Schinkia azotoformans]
MLASDLIKQIQEQIHKNGNYEITVSVAYDNKKLIGAIDNIQVFNNGSYIEIRGEQ